MCVWSSLKDSQRAPRHSSQTLQQQFGSTNEAIIAPIRLASSGNVVAYRERRLLGRPRPLEVLDFEVPRLARAPLPVRLPAAVFRVDLRVAAADLLPPAERFVFARLVVVLPRLAVAFFVVERLVCLRGFSVVPVTASAMALAALETPSIAASMLVLAVSAIVPRTPSFSLSIMFTSLANRRSIFCFASATAPSFRGAKVRSVDRATSGKSLLVVWILAHQFAHWRVATISYPR